MKYLVADLRATAVKGKIDAITRHRDRIDAYKIAVLDSIEDWRREYKNAWITSLEELIEQVKEDHGVIEHGDTVSRDSGGIRYGYRGSATRYLPPTWSERLVGGSERLEKPRPFEIEDYRPDPIFDKLIAVCDMTSDTEISDSALRNVGFSQADFSKLVTLVARGVTVREDA